MVVKRLNAVDEVAIEHLKGGGVLNCNTLLGVLSHATGRAMGTTGFEYLSHIRKTPRLTHSLLGLPKGNT